MSKMLLWICMTLGGVIGGFLPMLWGSQDMMLSILFSTIGGIVGIWVWFKFFRWY
jgi:hypothetical protein